MFKWLNKQGVESDRGFAVQVLNRAAIEYREKSRNVKVEYEYGTWNGNNCVLIGSRAFVRWDNDPEGATNPLEKQQEMLSNFREAMEVLGLPVVVQDPV
jgi:hypothetical protein